MSIQSADLTWIVVSDIHKAKHFFSEILGLEIKSASDDYGWVELQGKKGGMTIGLAKADEAQCPVPAGGNGVITFTVDNIESMKQVFEQKNIQIIGDVMEIPGHVKLLMFKDPDGNYFQLAEVLSNP